MKVKIFALFIFFIISKNGAGQNLITNSTFEQNGMVVCDDWYDPFDWELSYICDTIPDSVVYFCHSFVNDAPSGGGMYSLGILTYPHWLGADVRHFITGHVGIFILDVSGWMKLDSNNTYGQIQAHHLRNDSIIKYMYTNSSYSSNWTFESFIDTINLIPNDTLVINLDVGTGGPLDGRILFDLISAELTPYTSVGEENYSDNWEIYPNPIDNYLTLKNINIIESYKIRIFDSLGSVILEKVCETKECEIATSNLAAGLYVINIVTEKYNINKKIIKNKTTR